MLIYEDEIMSNLFDPLLHVPAVMQLDFVAFLPLYRPYLDFLFAV